jgi:ribosome recycling factor
MVQGSNQLIVKVFDESVQPEVLKALQRSDFDLNVQQEGKDIRIKLGTSRKEHMAAALKKVKEHHESFKKQARDARQKIMQTLKKLEKIVPKDQIKLLEDELDTLLKKTEDDAKKLCEAKEKEINA